MSDIMPKAYRFEDHLYSSLPQLANALALSWQRGKSELFSGRLRLFFQSFDQSMAKKCTYSEQEKKNRPELGEDYVFLKWLCKIPGIKAFYWKGRIYGTMSTLSNYLLKKESDLPKAVNLLLKDEYFSAFAENNQMPEDTIKKIKHIENVCIKENTLFQKKNAYLVLSSVLCNQQTYSFDSRDFSSVKELAIYLRGYASKGQRVFENQIRKIFVDEYNLDPIFEGWLINIGKKDALSLWRERFQKGIQNSDDNEENPFFEEEEAQNTAKEQDLTQFAGDVFEFENKFLELLNNYGDLVFSPRQFEALIKDFFPQHQLQSHLIITLLRMDIATSISEAESLDELFMSRYTKRMVRDFGFREEFAKWAASVWCCCYGGQYLHKECSVTIFKVI